MRVELFFTTGKDPQLEEKVKGINIIRLKCWVQFKTDRGWSIPYRAIIDTGAPVSLIPRSLWKVSQHIALADHNVRGVVPSAEAVLSVKVGKLSCRLMDTEGNETEELEIHSFLAPNDEVNLILGFKDLLERFRLCFDFLRKEAYIDVYGKRMG